MNTTEQQTAVNTASERVGVVTIGRNEGERLIRCLESVKSELPASVLVYVDSRSTDDSVAEAERRGVEVVPLDLSRKFTAARARNAGYRRLLSLAPETEFVLFLDGDCELVPGFVAAALEQFAREERAAVVCGRRREKHPESSIYNRLCDLEWDTPVGQAAACGGDALIRTAALVEVNGYDESLIAGEEPDMCLRMAKKGHEVHRIDAEMTRHDAAMTQVSQWFRRSQRAGHASMERAVLHFADPGRPGLKQSLSSAVWGLAIPTALVGASVMVGPLPSTLGGALLYGHLYRKSYSFERRRRSTADARLFAASCVAAKLPEALGALTYVKNKVLRKPSVLIEYKRPSPPRPQTTVAK